MGGAHRFPHIRVARLFELVACISLITHTRRHKRVDRRPIHVAWRQTPAFDNRHHYQRRALLRRARSGPCFRLFDEGGTVPLAESSLFRAVIEGCSGLGSRFWGLKTSLFRAVIEGCSGLGFGVWGLKTSLLRAAI